MIMCTFGLVSVNNRYMEKNSRALNTPKGKEKTLSYSTLPLCIPL